MKNVLDWPIGKLSSYIRTTPDIASFTAPEVIDTFWLRFQTTPYSADFAISENLLFPSLQYSLNEKLSRILNFGKTTCTRQNDAGFERRESGNYFKDDEI